MYMCSLLARWMLMTAGSAIVFALPLSLAGCGESDGSAQAGVAVKNFSESHKDSMSEFLKNKREIKGQKKAKK
jgi:hypothetical protein